MMNILTFDIEDWYHPNLAIIDSEKSIKIEDRVVDPTLKIINMLEQTNNRATFFVLGEVAKKFPELVQEMINKGHEVGSHGYRHDLVYNYTKYQFETDIQKAVEVLENITNQKVLGYRAPSWSLNEQTPWVWETLLSHGFKYDSSIYPYKTFLYGNNSSPRFIHQFELKNGELMQEVPPSAVEVLGKRLPFSGGFFLRVSPTWYLDWGISQYERVGKPAVIYLHPWEIDVEQPRLQLSTKDRFIMYVNIRKTETKLMRLLNKYQFESIKNYLSLSTEAKNSASNSLSVDAVM